MKFVNPGITSQNFKKHFIWHNSLQATVFYTRSKESDWSVSM